VNSIAWKPEASWSELLSGRNAVRSLVLAGGVGLHATNIYIVTTILPSVVHDIGGLEYYAWSTALFVVTSIVGSALAAKLLERFGPKAAYAAAAIVFGLGTLVCAGAWSMPMLLVGRAIQGFGGGMLFALPYALIRLVFEERLWPRAMTILSGMWGIATLIGPAMGGLFAEIGAWRAAFWSLLPLTAVFTALAATVLPKRSSGEGVSSPIAFTQLSLLMAAVLALSAGSVSQRVVWNVAGIAAAGAVSLLLIVVERSSPRRLLPRGAFRLGSPFLVLYATMSLLAVTVTSSEIFMPLFFQTLHGQTPLAAGYLAALMAGGWTLGSISSAGATGKRIARVLRIAPALMLAGMSALAILVPRPSDGSLVRLAPTCLALVAVGFGVGLAWPHLLTRVLGAATQDEALIASSSITTVQLFATSLGAALAGMVANLGGLGDSLDVASVSTAARYLFAVFAMGPALGVFTSGRIRA
jgi:MFS family permease